MKPLSKLKMAHVFDVNRLTIYSWISKGCPCGKPERPGKPASMDFKPVLQWRLAQLAGFGYTKDELQVLESKARVRLAEMNNE
ncbi:MAG: hypothetical protein ABIU05_27435 [Nitrospirales bacterium]